jgi:UDP-N-acetylglucosamine--N-acetylmuramyl-(pentapeptide) pyrophosphoryl-undecaprenol N-acetylglucosamine transferase
VNVRRFALVTGGGTGGHLVPALTVARVLQTERPPGSVELVGSRRGLDAELLAGSGLPTRLLPGRGLSRRHDLASLAANIGAVVALGAAFLLALGVVARRRPSVVVALGGYASVPVALAAATWRVPVVLVNVDAVPGAANRLIGRMACASAVAFPGTALPRTVVTGTPVRPELVAAAGDADARRRARETLGIPQDRLVVGVVGGSLGSRTINRATVGLARRWRHRREIALYHVTGRRDASWMASETPAPSPDGLWYRQVAYEQDMAALYGAADVIVGRAGANTVAELAVTGRASLLVPLPGAPDDHQAANAAVLVRAGAAVVLPDGECTAERLEAEIGALLRAPVRLAAMSQAALLVGRPDAARAVASLVCAQARPAGRGRSRRAACGRGSIGGYEWPESCRDDRRVVGDAP